MKREGQRRERKEGRGRKWMSARGRWEEVMHNKLEAWSETDMALMTRNETMIFLIQSTVSIDI
jgi:hypothetical protein